MAKSLPKPSWIRPGGTSLNPLWGIKGGIQVALWPAAIEGAGDGGPRGLLRVGYPVLEEGTVAGLVNFIAVEPEVQDHPKGYSELERSTADGKPGKPMWASKAVGEYPDMGTMSHPDPKHPEIEELSVTIHMEKFANGAHPYLRLSIRSDRPDELRLQSFHEPDSVPMERCILTATMGNFARVRHIQMKHETVDSRKLFRDYTGDGFTHNGIFPVSQLIKTGHGDVVVPLTTDEIAPASVQPFPNDPMVWKWRGIKVTQYWRKDAGQYEDDLQLRVNARHTYWMSQQPIPGGNAFENVEFREKYRSGQESIFGITRLTPSELIN